MPEKSVLLHQCRKKKCIVATEPEKKCIVATEPEKKCIVARVPEKKCIVARMWEQGTLKIETRLIQSTCLYVYVHACTVAGYKYCMLKIATIRCCNNAGVAYNANYNSDIVENSSAGTEYIVTKARGTIAASQWTNLNFYFLYYVLIRKTLKLCTHKSSQMFLKFFIN